MLFVLSCKKDIPVSDVYVKKIWKVDLSASQIVPSISNRTDHAVASVYLMDNNELYYYIYFDQLLNNGDKPLGASIYIGTAGINGILLAELKGSSFNEKRENDGKISLSEAAVNSLLTENNLYLSIASIQQNAGLVRGQLK